jgi:aldehyde:ferredoxin oxidoreductase
MVAKFKLRRQFIDLLGICNMRVRPDFTLLINLVNTATGWTLTVDDAIAATEREVNILRAFNIRHGVSLEVEALSTLYSSVPVDGPAECKDIKPHWNHTLDEYYKHMGWDRESDRPLLQTLRNLGLETEARDLWENP